MTLPHEARSFIALVATVAAVMMFLVLRTALGPFVALLVAVASSVAYVAIGAIAARACVAYKYWAARAWSDFDHIIQWLLILVWPILALPFLLWWTIYGVLVRLDGTARK